MGRTSDRIGLVKKITAVVWYKGNKYEQTLRNPDKANYQTFVDLNLPDNVYERKLYGWASFINGRPKSEFRSPDIKAGETVILCARCGGFHGAFDTCPG